MAALMLGAMVVAGLSLLVGQSLRFDPQGWLRWGREIGLGKGPFDTSGYPSWKPLPLLLAVPLAPTGAAAPFLWLFVLRAAGFLALAMVACLTARRAGALGGAIAAGLLALTPGWWPTLLGGGIEPAVVMLGCAAVVAHQRQRPGLALALVAAMALGREEALPLMLAYGVAQRHRGARWLVGVTAAAVGVVTAWLLGDWLGSGDPWHGGTLARAAAADSPFAHLDGVRMVATVALIPPLLTLVGVGVTAAARNGDRIILATSAAALTWTLTDVVLLALGYPMPARFLIPAAAAWAAAAGVGVSAAQRVVAQPMAADAASGSYGSHEQRSS